MMSMICGPSCAGDSTDEQIAELVRTAMQDKLVDGWAAQKQGAQRADGDRPEEMKPVERHRDSMTQIGG